MNNPTYVALCMLTDWFYVSDLRTCYLINRIKVVQVIHVQSTNHISLKKALNVMQKSMYTGCVHTISWHCGHSMKEQRTKYSGNQSAHFERLPFWVGVPSLWDHELSHCMDSPQFSQTVEPLTTFPDSRLPLCHFKDLMYNCRYYIANFIPCRAIDVLQGNP